LKKNYTREKVSFFACNEEQQIRPRQSLKLKHSAINWIGRKWSRDLQTANDETRKACTWLL